MIFSHCVVYGIYICTLKPCRIGFVTFKEAESAQMALSASEDQLVLDDRCAKMEQI